MNKRIFSQEEQEYILSSYSAGKSINKIRTELKVSSYTVSNFLKEKGIEILKKSPCKYSPEDIDFIKKYYPVGDWEKLFERFGPKSRDAIHHLAAKYKIKSESLWSNEDVQILKDNMYTKRWGQIQKLLKTNRTIFSIQTKAFKLGYHSDCWWTDAEKDLLKENYCLKTLEELCLLLPNHPRSSIATQAWKMGLKTKERYLWTQEEIDFLLGNWETMSDQELENHLCNRTASAIAAKRLKLNCYRFCPSLDFSDQYNTKLKKYMRNWIGDWIGEIMDRDGHKCFLTGSTDIAVHHVYSFDFLVNQFLSENNISNKEPEEFDKEELQQIGMDFKAYHNANALGICIDKKLHKLFHNLYGRATADEINFNDFVKQIKNKEIQISK